MIFDAGYSGDDVPTRIGVDGTNAIYVCAGIETSSEASNYALWSIDDSGNMNWMIEYDHSDLDDVPAAMKVNEITHEIYITGGSATTQFIYELATVKYDQTGDLLDTYRSNYNAGIAQATCMDIDTSGNIYIGGWHMNMGEMMMSLICLNDTLGVEWNTTHDYNNGGEDKIMDLKVMANGDLFVTGHTEDNIDGYMIYTARFIGGAVDWEETYLSPNGGAFGKRLAIEPDGDINVVGMMLDADTNIVTLQFTYDGTINFAVEHDAGGEEIPATIETDNWGNIYVHGTSTANGNGYVTLKYSSFIRQMNVINDTVDSVDYVSNEMIVQFYPHLIDTNAVNNKGKTFGQLSEFVKPEAVDSLNSLFGYEFDFGRMNTVKIYRLLTTENDYSISRLGDTLEMPPFWSTFVIITPENFNLLDGSLLIDTMLVNTLMLAEINQINVPDNVPNDSHYTNGLQQGLESSNSPANDINIESAWDYNQGRFDVKVGVVDAGIQWAHQDFNVTGTVTNSFSDSKVSNGYNFFNHSFIDGNLNNDASATGHGSKVAGIIGAVRNNSLGVAGIAGGDADIGNFGVQLIDLKIGIKYDHTAAIEAIVEGARWQPDAETPGYGCDVLNLSFGHKKVSQSEETAVRFAYDNACVFAASAGNDDQEKARYPSSYADRMVIKVGASGMNGERKSGSSGSNYGHKLDILAPGEVDLVLTTSKSPEIYVDFGQTSAATPHVAGFSSLLISEVKDNWNPNGLAPEDVENLIQNYPSFVNGAGYKAESGWGRLNAGLVMENMEWPFYWVQHFGANTTSYTSSLLLQNVKIGLERAHGGISKGKYKCDIYTVQCTLSHSIGGANILGAWARNGSAVSTPYELNTNLKPEANTTLTYFDNSTAVLIGFIYHFKNKWGIGGTGASVQQWLPTQTGNAARFAYSLHLHDPEATGIVDQVVENGYDLEVWPNPAGDVLNVITGSDHAEIEVLDIRGVVVTTMHHNGLAPKLVDVSKLPSGVYIVSAKGINGTRHAKFVKN